MSDQPNEVPAEAPKEPVKLDKPIVIATVGLPRSGKSTILTKLANRLKAPIVCRDSIRMALHGQRYQSLAEPFVKAISLIMVRSLIFRGHLVVLVDETNYSKAARAELLSPWWDLLFLEVPTDPETCKERARATGQDDLIPVIDEMWGRYEPLEEKDNRLILQGEVKNESVTEEPVSKD